ncbi:hypothetical protein AB4Y36_13695 [Paraburkholderia sp. BR10936]|uniref:hypothetical protein n=1 Tax=Paraburkholderia sp. BR10936 TaxID=3236993 RepID=UPI0034D228C2
MREADSLCKLADFHVGSRNEGLTLKSSLTLAFGDSQLKGRLNEAVYSLDPAEWRDDSQLARQGAMEENTADAEHAPSDAIMSKSI